MIYIIDDDSEDLELIQSVYNETKLPKELKVFENGIEFLSFLNSKTAKKEVPGYIITDLKMPALDGIAMTESLRSKSGFTNVPVVMLSTSNLNYDIEKAYKSGVNCFLTKPNSYDGWRSTINTIELWVKRWYDVVDSKKFTHSEE